jgi:hypothetical protein
MEQLGIETLPFDDCLGQVTNLTNLTNLSPPDRFDRPISCQLCDSYLPANRPSPITPAF